MKDRLYSSALCIPTRRIIFRQSYTIKKKKAQFSYGRFFFLLEHFFFFPFYTHHCDKPTLLGKGEKCVCIFMLCIQLEGKILFTMCTILGYYSKM